MSSPLVHKLITLIALPIVLLAHALCVCGLHTSNATRSALVERVPACCAARAAAPAPIMPTHDSQCPHCGKTAGDVLTAADARPEAPVASALEIAWLAPLELAFHPTSPVQTVGGHLLPDPAPPPDVLRATCVLLV